MTDAELKAQRTIKRVAEFDATISIWTERQALAERMIAEATSAKDNFIANAALTLF